MKSKGAFICAFKSSQVLRWIKGVLQRSYKFGRGGGDGESGCIYMCIPERAEQSGFPKFTLL